MINLKWYRLIIIGTALVLTTSCSEFALLASGSSLAMSQNSYAKMYNAVDFGVVITTKKGIKYHVYEKGKKYNYEKGKKHVHTLTRIVND